ncbi:MAG: septum site-determining protein MinC [Acetatifactor sp.]|nr:septum site-determining protein MinC [Acetatifactor sp.]
MQDLVVIKSFQKGITLHLNEDAEFEEVLSEIEQKFAEGKKFFGKSNMALSIKGRHVSDAEELRILDAIRENSNVRIVCIVGQDEETNRRYIKALQQVEKRMTSADKGQFYKESLKNKEVLETEHSIVILGDVYPGSAVISKGSIIILGGLYGEAYAGDDGREDAYVVALEMEPERIKIGDFKYKPKDKAKWGIRPKVQPKIAYVKNERIVMEPLTKELLSSF